MQRQAHTSVSAILDATTLSTVLQIFQMVAAVATIVGVIVAIVVGRAAYLQLRAQRINASNQNYANLMDKYLAQRTSLKETLGNFDVDISNVQQFEAIKIALAQYIRYLRTLTGLYDSASSASSPSDWVIFSEDSAVVRRSLDAIHVRMIRKMADDALAAGLRVSKSNGELALVRQLDAISGAFDKIKANQKLSFEEQTEEMHALLNPHMNQISRICGSANEPMFEWDATFGVHPMQQFSTMLADFTQVSEQIDADHKRVVNSLIQPELERHRQSELAAMQASNV